MMPRFVEADSLVFTIQVFMWDVHCNYLSTMLFRQLALSNSSALLFSVKLCVRPPPAAKVRAFNSDCLLDRMKYFVVSVIII